MNRLTLSKELGIALIVAVLLTLVAGILLSPIEVGITRSAMLGDISAVQGFLETSELPKSLNAPFKRKWLPADLPRITENGRRLAYPGTGRQEIIAKGHGRFRIAGSKVYLSSSDGTSPAANGRSYEVFVSAIRAQEWVIIALFCLALIAWIEVARRCQKAGIFRIIVGRVLVPGFLMVRSIALLVVGLIWSILCHLWGVILRALQMAIRFVGVCQSFLNAVKGPNPVMERLCRKLSPACFFTGVVLGVIICGLLGRRAAEVDIFHDRSRFFFKVSPEAYVFPTLENLCSYVEGKASRSKILVLVGGSSIPLGVGQQNAVLWTDMLGQRLGDRFCVVNVSFRAAKHTSIVVPLAEELSGKYSKIIMVSDTIPTDDPGWLQYNESAYAYPYDYIPWQRWIRGGFASHPERNKEFFKALRSPSEKIRTHATEEVVRALLERASYSSNLWNLIGYRYFFTIYSRLLMPGTPFWTPRESIPDDDTPAESRAPIPARFENAAAAAESVMQGMFVGRVRVSPEGRFSYVEAPAKEALAARIPDEDFRSRLLFIVASKASYFVGRLSSEDRARYEFAILGWVDALREAGFRAIPLGLDYSDEDYVDTSHFSEKAAPKMADDVMREIQKIAKSKGWIDEP